MQLGTFSVSLNVKDINASLEFYQKIGFTQIGGDLSQNWAILRNGNATIGLFQGMFEGNILTFNPGWDENAQLVEGYTDVRELQKEMKSKGITLVSEADESTSGPGHLITTDPDGNTIMLDQHV